MQLGDRRTPSEHLDLRLPAKGHFGYGHGAACYFPSPPLSELLAERVFHRYTTRPPMSIYEAVIDALESFQPTPHPDAGYTEPIRD